MARYQIIIAYDGTEFFGFQRQGRVRTVQSEIENGLRQLGWKGKTIQAAGRTDTGVHASGQVIAIDLEWKYDTDVLVRAINANLPHDIAALSAVETSPGFHPRFDASGRRYVYRLYCQEQRHPLKERFAWRVWPEPDFASMQNASKIFMGEHDFRSFGKPMKPGGNTIRRVSLAEWRRPEEGFEFTIIADAFLYHMVRRIVFVSLNVGMGQMTEDNIMAALESGKRLRPGLAPAYGLNLAEVYYA